MPLTSLGDALKRRFQSTSPLKRQIETSTTIETAKTVFQNLFPSLDNSINPLFLKNRTLTISCSSSAVAQEIRLRQAEIVENLNHAIGETLIDRIRYLL